MVEVGTKKRGTRRTQSGTVVSRSGDKSIVVEVETRKPHPVYAKIVRQKKKFHAHDETNQAVVGDKVVIIEARPTSKLKRWRLLNVTGKSA